MTRPLKVFLSHAHADANAVHALYDRLVADGVDAWLDKEKLIPGQDWEREIRKAVREADVVIVCLSKQFNQRGYRQKEVRIALDEADMMPEGEIFIIPARLEECENLESLRKWHWVDLYEKNGYQQLLRSLEFRAKKVGTELEPKKNLITGAFRKPIAKRQNNPEKTETNKPKQEKTQAKEKAALPSLVKIDASLRRKVQRYAPFFLIVVIASFVAFTLPSWFSQAKPSPKATSTQTKKVLPAATATENVIVEPSATPASSKTDHPENTPTNTPLPEEISDIDPAGNEIPMRLVPAGEFIMGSDNEADSEYPFTSIYLDSFYIDTYEITNELYRACVNAEACTPPDNINKYNDPSYTKHPVVYVDWYQAKDYCEWRGGHLPNETQWEKAARGTDGRTYPWGNEEFTCEHINSRYFYYAPWENPWTGQPESNAYEMITSSCVGETVAVGSYEKGKSPFNIFDLAGNVSEWTATTGIVRGGSWYSTPIQCKTYHQFKVYETTASDRLGFRCAKGAP